MIRIEHLVCGFGKKEVLKDINCTIGEGGFCALLGANGCGKTTLLRCVAGLLEPWEGRVEVDGKDVREYGAIEKAKKMSLVRQQAQTDFEFSAFEIVLMGRNPYQRHLQNESKSDWDIVETCMKQTSTWHLRLSKPHEMSGGELQRVMIARALAQQTPIMLLDEPTSNLDIAHQYDTMHLLKGVTHSQRKTVLLVVHDLNLALRYCPDIILLHEGGILYQGPTKEGLTPDNIKKAFNIEARVEGDYLAFSRVRE
ncbi:MAG: ABC transporter ATP-binding protein [Bacteroidales bacterium]|nr:ABC transporter ATP-binding protein [Bacteroidales bacterium]